MSLFNRGEQYEQEEGEAGEPASEWTNHTIFSPSEGVVDDICGYSFNLVPIFSEIGSLARARYENLSYGPVFLEEDHKGHAA